MSTQGVDYEQIVVEDRGPVRLITLSRPEKLNAWTRRMSRELVDAIEDGNDDPAIGAFVMTGAGRGFCAGADIGAEFASGASAQNIGDRADRAAGGSERKDRDWVALIREAKPIVAAINGPAVGVGLTMVLPMDYLVAGRSARLSARFVRMGVVPELASSHFLVQRCGWGAASDLSLSGRIVDAEEANTLGLVDRVVDDEELLDVAIGHAETYAENPPAIVRMVKELLTANGTDQDLVAVQQRETERLREAMASPDHAEAIAAFQEKRPPKFR
jgi:2-(1,2-epoxy-1,2-dihydrophenyl)acetyl-CoA isomerase